MAHDRHAIRAAQYVRMSTEHQRYSPEHQRAALAAYAGRHGFEIVRTYSDEGISGLRLETRPGLKQLLADAVSGDGGFSAILVYDVSRWGRFQDPDQSAHYEFLCRAAGVRVEYCAEPFENDGSMTGVLLKQIKRAMAAEYSRELSTKVAEAQARLAAKGLWQGGPPGYALRRRILQNDGRLGAVLGPGEWKSVTRDRVVLVAGPEEEVAVVRRIFRLFVVGGMSRATVSRTLNAEGIPAENGAAWSATRVAQVLTNEKYLGVQVFGRSSKRLGGRMIRRDERDWIRSPAAFSPLVSPRMFALAHRNIAKRYRCIPDEEMLEGLRDILRRHGKITAKLIEAEEHLPCAEAYRVRWGGLVGAYAQVGYAPSERALKASAATRRGSPCRRRNRPDQLEDDVLLARLASLYLHAGRLSVELMRNTPGLPSPDTYRKAFGSLRRAYQLVGYAPDARQELAMRKMTGRGARPRIRAVPMRDPHGGTGPL